MRRLLRLLIPAQIACLVAVLGFAAPAHADADCSNHCYSIAIYDQSYLGGITGTAANIERNNMLISTGNPGAPWAHINSEYWFILDNNNYLEEGLRLGDDSGSATGGCGCISYDQFWADHVRSGSNDQEWRHIIADGVNEDGSWDAWNMLWGPGSGVWNIGLNGNVVGVSRVTGDNYGYELQMGGEYVNTQCVNGGYAQDTDMYANTYYLGAWHPPAWNNSAIDPNCGLGGSSFQDGEWSWNKNES